MSRVPSDQDEPTAKRDDASSDSAASTDAAANKSRGAAAVAGDETDGSAPEDGSPIAQAIAQIDPLLREQIATHPLRTLGIAVLVGFAVGGGLSSRAGRFGFFVAARYAARQLWRDAAVVALGRAMRSVPARTP